MRDVRGDRRKFYEGLVGELIEFAERQFKLSRKAPDGASERDHLASAARQLALAGKKLPKALDPVVNEEQCPEGAEYLWRWLLEIVMGIDGNGFAPPVISWAHLDAWCRLRGVALEPWEALALVQLGVIRAVVLSEKTNTPTPGGRSNG